MSANGLRIVTLNNLPPAYQLVAGWAEQSHHKIVLVVTTPGPSTRRSLSYRGVVTSAPVEQDVLVTTRLLSVAAPLIRALAPDLIVSFTFPHRIPPEITSIPRYGAVNLHPSPLPHYRGPNPNRMIYDGFPIIGATLHRIEEDFDTGAIYSQHTAPLPEPTTVEALWQIFPRLIMRALAEGVERAVAGEPGTPQDHSQASYAAPFTEAEHWLNWAQPMASLQRKVAALNVFNAGEAKAMIDGQAYAITKIETLPDHVSDGESGTVVAHDANSVSVRAADGTLRVFGTKL